MIGKKENIQGISKRNDMEGRKKDHRCMERGRILLNSMLILSSSLNGKTLRRENRVESG